MFARSLWSGASSWAAESSGGEVMWIEPSASRVTEWAPGMVTPLADLGANRLARADRVPLKVQYPRTPKRPGVPRERERGPLFLRETRSRTSYERGSETTRRGFLEPCLVTRKLLSNSRAKGRFLSCTPTKTLSRGRSQGWEGSNRVPGPQWTPMAHNRPACPQSPLHPRGGSCPAATSPGGG